MDRLEQKKTADFHWLTYRRWVEGLLPHYKPTMVDLLMLAQGKGLRDPVVIHNYPVAMSVLKLV